MKIEKIIKMYDLDTTMFYEFLSTGAVPVETGFYSDSINDNLVEDAVKKYHNYKEEKDKTNALNAEERAKREKALEEERLKAQREISSIVITSGYDFEGYEIVKYSGYISGDDVIEIDRGSGGLFGEITDLGPVLMESLTKMRSQALKELKEAAYALDCNAIIGVDFDYMNFAPETKGFNSVVKYLPYIFGVTANGTAVKIVKKE